MSISPPPEIRLAATVLIVRQGADELDVLLLRRNAQLAFAGGAWVFPGGAVDTADGLHSATEEQAARVAAVREAQEECGIVLRPEQLAHFAHWTTPTGEKRRFATWFFAAVVPSDASDVLIDEGEIHEYRWLSPKAILTAHASGELNIMPPTYITVKLLEPLRSAEKAIAALVQRKPFWVTPKVSVENGKPVLLYPGDAGYITNQAKILGPRHRTLFSESGLQYIHSGDDVGVVAMDDCE